MVDDSWTPARTLMLRSTGIFSNWKLFINIGSGSGPTFHGMEVGMMGFRLIWDKATSFILLLEFSGVQLCEVHSTKYYRSVVVYYK